MEFCLRLTTDGAIDHLGENERHLLRTDIDLVPTCKVFVRKCCVVLGFVLYAQEYGTAIFWQPFGNWLTQKGPYHRKGFSVYSHRESNQRPSPRQAHALATWPPGPHICIYIMWIRQLYHQSVSLESESDAFESSSGAWFCQGCGVGVGVGNFFCSYWSQSRSQGDTNCKESE